MATSRAQTDPQTTTGAGGDVEAALAAGGVAAGAVGSGAGAQALAVSAEVAARATASAVRAIVRFGRQRQTTLVPMLVSMLRREFPERTESELSDLVKHEIAREREFVARMAARIRRDIPEALRTSSPDERARRVRSILDRERRIIDMRERAMAERAVGAAQVARLREQSPDGAVWRLGDAVEHTPECLALANQALPHAVLSMWHPPLHAGCKCWLQSIDDALREGVIPNGDVPGASEAMRRVRGIMSRLGRHDGQKPPEPQPVPEFDQVPAVVEAVHLKGRGGGDLVVGAHGRGGAALKVWDESWVIRNRIGQFAEWVKRIPIGGVGVLGHSGASVRRNGDGSITVVNGSGDVVADGLHRIEEIADAAEKAREVASVAKSESVPGRAFDVDPGEHAPVEVATSLGSLESIRNARLPQGWSVEGPTMQYGARDRVTVNGEVVAPPFDGQVMVLRGSMKVGGEDVSAVLTVRYVRVPMDGGYSRWEREDGYPRMSVVRTHPAPPMVSMLSNDGYVDQSATPLEMVRKNGIRSHVDAAMAKDGFYYAGESWGGAYASTATYAHPDDLQRRVAVTYTTVGKPRIVGVEWVPPGVEDRAATSVRDARWSMGDDPVETFAGWDAGDVYRSMLLNVRPGLRAVGPPQYAEDSDGQRVTVLEMWQDDPQGGVPMRMLFRANDLGTQAPVAFGYPDGVYGVSATPTDAISVAREAAERAQVEMSAQAEAITAEAKRWWDGDGEDEALKAALSGLPYQAVMIGMENAGWKSALKRDERSEVAVDARGNATLTLTKRKSKITVKVAGFRKDDRTYGAPRYGGTVQAPRVTRAKSDAPARRLGRLPETWDEMRQEVRGRAVELADRFGARSDVKEVTNRTSSTYGGLFEWSGTLVLETRSRDTLVAYLGHRKRGEEVPSNVLSGAFNAMRVLQHEINHGVNAEGRQKYEHGDGSRAAEEAVVEEAAHLLGAEWMKSLGMDDLLAWGDANPGSFAAMGTYRRYRENLRTLMDDAGIAKEDRADAILTWCFKWPSGERLKGMGAALVTAGRVPSATRAMEDSKKAGEAGDEANAKMLAQTALAAGQYAAIEIMRRNTKNTIAGGSDPEGFIPVLPIRNATAEVDFSVYDSTRLGGPDNVLPVGAVVRYKGAEYRVEGWNAPGREPAAAATYRLVRVATENEPRMSRDEAYSVLPSEITERIDSEWKVVEYQRNATLMDVTRNGMVVENATFLGMSASGDKATFRAPSGRFFAVPPFHVTKVHSERFSWSPDVQPGAAVWSGLNFHSPEFRRFVGTVLRRDGNARVTVLSPAGETVETVLMGTNLDVVPMPTGWSSVLPGMPVEANGKRGTLIEIVASAGDGDGSASYYARVALPDGSEVQVNGNLDGSLVALDPTENPDLDAYRKFNAPRPMPGMIAVRGKERYAYLGMTPDGWAILRQEDGLDTARFPVGLKGMPRDQVDYFGFPGDPDVQVEGFDPRRD